MGDLVELNRKHDNLSVDEVLALAQREEYDDVFIVGFKKRYGLSVWFSDMTRERAHWLAAKAQATMLRNS